MKHSRRLVFAGVLAALAAMTILSVLLGRAVSFLPAVYIHYAEIALFLGFGLKLLYEAAQMPTQSDGVVAEEAMAAVKEAKLKKPWKKNQLGVVLEAFCLTFMAEWGDRTQIATIALAASNSAVGVTTGAIVGHGICAAIAVLGGRLIAGRISERMVTGIGGCLFLLFGAIAFWQGV
jgi:putative Ca2+/H+ antiporter (TMEM165/GDT1 family)